MSAPTIVLGIDPGYGRLGWSVGEAHGAQLELLAYGCIETSTKLSLFARYTELQAELQKILKQYRPDEAALESLFFSKNQKTAMDVSEARGVVLGTLLGKNIRCYSYSPGEVKIAITGSGSADKAAVERMVRLQFAIGHVKMIDDTFDAIAVTLAHTVSRTLKKLL